MHPQTFADVQDHLPVRDLPRATSLRPLGPANQRAAFPLMDERFQVTDELFILDVSSWPAENRDFGRLAD